MVTRSETIPISVFFEVFPIASSTRSRFEDAFHEDQDPLAADLAAPLPCNLVCLPLPEVDPDEFEKLYLWFLS
jgi:hypothetical protein